MSGEDGKEEVFAIIEYVQAEDHREVYANGARLYTQGPFHLKIAFFNDVPIEMTKKEELIRKGDKSKVRTIEKAYDGPPQLKRVIHTTVIVPFGAVPQLARTLSQVAEDIEHQERIRLGAVKDERKD